MTQKRNLSRRITAVVMLVFMGLVMFFIVFSIGISLFQFAEKTFWPESYWSGKVVKIEERLLVGGEKYSQCRLKIAQDHGQNQDFYANMRKQGADHNFAFGIVAASVDAREKGCDRILDELTTELTKLSDAKTELQKASQ